MRIKPNCAARTVENDIPHRRNFSARRDRHSKRNILGSSPIRRLVEDWTVDIRAHHRNAVKFAVGTPSFDVRHRRHHSTIPHRQSAFTPLPFARRTRRRLCDTSATPHARRLHLVQFVIREVVQPSGEKNSRGLARPKRPRSRYRQILSGRWPPARIAYTGAGNALGERVAHAHGIDARQSHAHGSRQPRSQSPQEYCDTVALATPHHDSAKLSVIGKDAFRTATGVHASALIKAFKKGDVALANSVLQRVLRIFFGLDQSSKSPLRRQSNVLFCWSASGIPADERPSAHLDAAKQSARILTDEELH